MPAALDILQQTFGYPSFRGPQEKIIQTVIDGGDALVLMPTGGGKSLCYQIPVLARAGRGVVISPLRVKDPASILIKVLCLDPHVCRIWHLAHLSNAPLEKYQPRYPLLSRGDGL